MNGGSTSNVNVKQAVPFLAVADMEDSPRFYVDGHGCVMIKDPDGCQLDFESVTDVPEGTEFDESNPR